MLSQTTFKIDEKIKKKAQEKARKMGMTLSDVLKMATMDFIEGKFEIGLVYREQSRKI